MKIASRVCSVVLALLAGAFLAVPVAQADFGVIPGSLTVNATNGDGTNDGVAGSHPYAFTVHFDAKTLPESDTLEGGDMRDVVAELPPGLFGDPTAIPRCPRQLFEGGNPYCPPSSQIGVLHLQLSGGGGGEAVGPVFNLVPVPGAVAEFGFATAGVSSYQYVSLRSQDDGNGERYGVTVTAPDLPLAPHSVTETLWGVPADPSHNAERACAGSPSLGCTTDAEQRPFLTLPASCRAPLATTLNIDSKLNAGVFSGETTTGFNGTATPEALGGCEGVPFSPSVLASTASTTDSASGLDFEVKLPNQGLLDTTGTVETEPQTVQVVFPAGVTVNPSVADGIGTCSPAQYQAETAQYVPGQGCPASSKIGTVVAHTPLLDETVEGSVYLATPHDNPFNSLLAVYIVGRMPERGIVIKQAGEVKADPNTGQLTATFDGLPPLPYSSFDVKLREGPRAPLITPATCGSYPLETRLYPFSEPNSPVVRSSQIAVTTGAGGAACPSSEAQQPNNPSFQAGTTVPVGGSYSPFTMSLSRQDGSQRFSAVGVSLPDGLTGKLAGVAECTDTQIAAAAARNGFGQGALEQSSPSCPTASQLGTVTAGVGAGSPFAVSGHAYLAGPYKGAPFSLAIVVPAVAGPFDLGNVVVRAALYIDPDTARVTVKSDPMPQILDGIPLDVRSISVSIDRSQFTLNPTSCEPTSVGGEALTTQNQTAHVSERFQVAGCQGLAFKPTFKASTSGKTSRRTGASLHVNLSFPKDALGKDANIRSVKVSLPKQLPSRLTTLQKACTASQFETNPAGCPAASRVGEATANTPVLPVPITGPAYFVSHGGAKFPELILVLQGDGVTIRLHGETFISKAGITSSTFRTVPDQPVTSFQLTLPQGPNSALAANGNLCNTKLAMPTAFTGQNGATLKQSTQIAVTGCAKRKVKHHARK